MKKIILSLSLMLSCMFAFSLSSQAATLGQVKWPTTVPACYYANCNTKQQTVENKIYLHWKKVDGATKYQVYRKKYGGSYSLFKTVTTNQTSDKSKGEFCYKVRAIKGTQKGAFSAEKSVITVGGVMSSRQYNPGSFVTSGTSQFAVTVKNRSGKKLYILGTAKGSTSATASHYVYPVCIINKATNAIVRNAFMSNNGIYNGTLGIGGDAAYSVINKDSFNKYFVIQAVGMIQPYINAYDDTSKYEYQATSLFTVNTQTTARIYALTTSSSKGKYVVQRYK